MIVPAGLGLQASSRVAIQRPRQQRLWSVVRLLSVIVTVVALGLDMVYPSTGVMLFWNGLIAYLPLLFLAAPGVWRNVCPMAALNGLPHRLGKGGTRRLSAKAQRRTPYIATGLFFLLVPLRTAGLDRDGHLLALFLVLMLGAAFSGGLVFSGKAGWCSQICPMLAVERLYGMSPLVVVRDTHCRPCVGCARNCYDLQPTTAARSDLSPKNNSTGTARLLFAGAMPWFCVGFFTQPHLASVTILGMLGVYGRLGLFAVLGAAGCVLLTRYGPWSPYQVVLAHAAVAVSIYYLVVVDSTLTALAMPDFAFGLLVHSLVLGVTVVWLLRALTRETASGRGHGVAQRQVARAA